jgi:cation:H+ antiporter
LEILLHIGAVIIGFILLIKGADFFVGGASSMARKLNISEIAIGLTIVALGTSAPELIVNLFSGADGLGEIVFGNIIGSNIFNLFLILGVAGTIYPLTVHIGTVWKEIPFSFIITILLFALINDQLIFGRENNQLGFLEALILFTIFLLFLGYVYLNTKTNRNIQQPEVKEYSKTKTIRFLIIGLAGLIFGGKLVVDNAVIIARYFELSEKLIGLTIIAAGTSLPELSTSAVAAYRKSSDIAIGNVIGSNIFNILFILSVSTITGPITYNPALNYDIYFLLLGTALLFIFMFTLGKKRLDRPEALVLIIAFLAYFVFLWMRN